MMGLRTSTAGMAAMRHGPASGANLTLKTGIHHAAAAQMYVTPKAC